LLTIKKSLGYANPRQAVQKNCKEKGVSKRDTPTSGGNQEMVYLDEGNIYRLIIKSRKPEAEKFESWVMDEVLPSIRKNGHYSLSITPQQAGEIRTLIHERFVVGTDLPYAWSRFNNHFRLASYKDLPASKYQEACQYIKDMPYKDTKEEMVMVPVYHVDRIVNYAALARKYWGKIQPLLKEAVGYDFQGHLFDVNECTRMALLHMEQLVTPETKIRLERIKLDQLAAG
jgi:hypothetical protein